MLLLKSRLQHSHSSSTFSSSSVRNKRSVAPRRFVLSLSIPMRQTYRKQLLRLPVCLKVSLHTFSHLSLLVGSISWAEVLDVKESRKMSESSFMIIRNVTLDLDGAMIMMLFWWYLFYEVESVSIGDEGPYHLPSSWLGSITQGKPYAQAVSISLCLKNSWHHLGKLDVEPLERWWR